MLYSSQPSESTKDQYDGNGSWNETTNQLWESLYESNRTIHNIEPQPLYS